jgi:glycosyltransferase involved in cell wall biosynthesis
MMSAKFENNPLVSIGVPVYNGGEFLEESLNSILDQTYQNWECIIVNNCSVDNTLEVAQSFIAKDSRFKLFDNKDFLNVMQNWNETAKHVSKDAEYFKIVPADDWITPEYIEEMLNVMENHPEIGICSSFRVDGTSVRGDGLDIYQGPEYNGRMAFEKEITAKIDVTGSANAYLCKVKFLKQLPGYPTFFNEENLHVDMELAYDLLNVSNFGFVFKMMSYTRHHPKSLTDSMTYQFNTHWNSREQILYKYKSGSVDLEKTYRDLRLKYAYFHLKKRFLRDKKCLDWHRQYLRRKFSLKEYIVGTLTRNSLSLKLKALFKKN